MALTFPDTLNGVRALCKPHGKTYVQLPSDYVTKGLPAYLLYRTGGTQQGPFREDRITIETYADGPAATYEAANKVHDALVDAWHDVDGVGLIDNIAVQTVPTEIPAEDGTLRTVTATYRVTVRGL